MSLRFRSLALTILAAFLVASVVFFVFTNFKARTSSHGDEAIAVDIDMAIASSPVVVMGRVIDEGKARNLRRDSTDSSKEHPSLVVPGTDYTVAVTKVLKGTIESNSEIKVAVGGGSYKGKKANLRATLIENEEYIFTLATLGSGHPNYYGLIEPF